MIATGQAITNPASGGLGIILNVRQVGQTADGRVIAQYSAIDLQDAGKNAGAGAGNPYGIGNDGASGLRSRLVDPRTLTEAQAVARGASRSDYRDALETRLEQAEDSQIGPKSSADLDPAERAMIDQLGARDAAVHQEEQAHAAAAGAYGSAPQYDYQIGPDGKAYAIGGHVDVNANLNGASPEARDRALATIQNAALAPNAPGGADLAAYRQASLQRATAGNDNTAFAPARRDAAQGFSITV